MTADRSPGCVICGKAEATPGAPLCRNHLQRWHTYLVDCDASCRPVDPGRWRRDVLLPGRQKAGGLPAWLKRIVVLGGGDFRNWNKSEDPPLQLEASPDPALAHWCDKTVTDRIRLAETWSSVLVYVGGVVLALLMLLAIVYAFGPEPNLALVQVALMGFGAGLLLFYGGIYKEQLCHMRYHRTRLTRELIDALQRPPLREDN
ncbi:hypothetical protein [Synechococcus sp. CS-1328]|uniref:hypothetical protein n=1 Tax=Synechococcus sp. CS-1328 TaxID=2847976 RepID=UPI00223B4EC0|nr:hypothetical protein [Synechococcus sp. CS-1328]MCT0223954.1 hypothetical protein [Synechococcus sp. CS-1328]